MERSFPRRSVCDTNNIGLGRVVWPAFVTYWCKSLGLTILYIWLVASSPPSFLQLPSGFKAALYADNVSGARSLAIGREGIVFVGTREGSVYAVVDADKDQVGEKTLTIIKGLQMPSGVAFRDGALYVGALNRILKFDDIESQLDAPPDPVVVYDKLPSDRWHGWKFISFGPDGALYVPVGAPCNVCEKSDNRYGSILRLDLDRADAQIFAHGVRNSVGFDWHPESKEMWFTDNGRDWLGDDAPPCELNHAPKAGLHFGFPYCHGVDILDPTHGQATRCTDFVPPAQELGPHVAPLGMRFYTGSMFPLAYQGQVFIAEHGSWNRTEPIGYRITTVRLESQQGKEYRVFAEGWLDKDRVHGRPVDVLVMPDGALLVSDDKAGVIYRISYQEG